MGRIRKFAQKKLKKNVKEIALAPKVVTAPPKPAPKPKPEITKPETFTSAKTGRTSGITLPDGRTFLGLSPEDAQTIATQETERTAVPVGAVSGIEALKKREEEQMVGELGQGLAPTTDVSGVQRDKIDLKQAGYSALAGTLTSPAALTGLGGAAVSVGTGVGAPIAPFLAVGGIVVGFISEMKKNIKEQRQDIIKGEAQNLMKNEQNLLKTAMYANRPIPVEQKAELVDMFNQQMATMDEDYARLTIETNDDLTLWLGQDGHKQLEKYITFNQAGGMRDILIFQMEQALNNPSAESEATLQNQISSSEIASATIDAQE